MGVYKKVALAGFPINKGKGKNKNYNATFNRRKEVMDMFKPCPPYYNGWWVYEFLKTYGLGGNRKI